MIHVIATLNVAPGRRPDLIAVFKRLAPLVHAEEGCIEYGATVDVASGLPIQPSARLDSLVVVEKWQSLEHLQTHLNAPHMVDFRAEVADYLIGIDLIVTTPV